MLRNLFKYSKYYSGKEPELIEGDVFKIIVPLDDEYSFDAQIGKSNTVDKTLMPADKTLMPADKTLIPVDKTLIPVDKTLMPADKTLISVDRTVDKTLSENERKVLKYLKENGKFME